MAHRRKPETMSEAELSRFMTAATALHDACCAPLIRPGGVHMTALTDLNMAVCDAIEKITGRPPPWMDRW